MATVGVVAAIIGFFAYLGIFMSVIKIYFFKEKAKVQTHLIIAIICTIIFLIARRIADWSVLTPYFH